MTSLESMLRVFVELHPEDAARAFETLEPEERGEALAHLPDRVVVALFERLSPHVAAPLVAELESERVGGVLSAMEPRPAASILQQIDEDHLDAVLAALPEGEREGLRELASYSADTAGGMMEPRVASLSIDFTVQEAIARIRETPREMLHYLYITDRGQRLKGVLNMRDLLLARPHDRIASLVRTNVAAVPATMLREEVVARMRELGFFAVPVVDFEGRLIGVVRHNEALAAGQLEALEDLQKLVGAGADERALSPVRTVVRSRLPWLYVNLVTAFLAAAVVGVFEGTISQVAALAVLLPVVAGQGGNTGAQALAVVMRGLALREILPGTTRRVVTKETLAGLTNGVLVAIVTAIAVYAWRVAAGDSQTARLGLAAVIGLSMIVNMVAAALAGAVIPLILQAMGRDPAQSAGIFLTTVTDIVGFAAFLGLAALFMPLIA